MAILIWIIEGLIDMALSPAEKKRVMDILDELEEEEVKRTLSSTEAFGNWLKNTLFSIYLKVKDALGNLWKAISEIFS